MFLPLVLLRIKHRVSNLGTGEEEQHYADAHYGREESYPKCCSVIRGTDSTAQGITGCTVLWLFFSDTWLCVALQQKA